MAGIKITDLGILTLPVSEDLLYIVDVSDTSQSPQGTSKQIELKNLGVGGDYNPTYTSSGNVTSINTQNAVYSVNGKTMNLGLYFQECIIDFDANSSASITVELPTGFLAAEAMGAVSIKFNSAPTSSATPIFSNGRYGGGGKIQITLQNYGGVINDVYDITATFVIQLQ